MRNRPHQLECLTYRNYSLAIKSMEGSERRRVLMVRAEEAIERIFSCTASNSYLRVQALKSLRDDIDDYIAILET